ncbi:hypothetical protein VTL71DRAFT_15183 [Oculimacula yallundae]|uniref:Uncharacterized protein n=1 Tax=Oculimacula yallundae TaxID=86028 RepID=A0ABR4CGG7_9HELO
MRYSAFLIDSDAISAEADRIISSLIIDPLSSTKRASHIIFGDAGDLLRLGVEDGEQSSSASSKTQGKSSSSVMKELECASSSQLEFERDDRLGQLGYAQDGDVGLEADVEGIAMGAVE